MAKQDKQEESKATQGRIDQLRWLEEAQQHLSASDAYMADQRAEAEEKEALLLGTLQDKISGEETKSQVFDPRLSTIVLDRAARVMALPPQGEVVAVSKDDIGKNLLMNLLVNWYKKTANEQMDFMVKWRLISLYSQVFGSQFILVPWRVNKRTGYIGPEINLINFRDSFPQPGVPNIDDADYFAHATRVSIDWLKEQDKATWNMEAIEELEKMLREEPKKKGGQRIADPYGGSEQRDADKTSLIERLRFPTVQASVGFPRIEIINEYRHDLWLTWVPRMIQRENSRPLLLRAVEAPKAYLKDGSLPIVKKDCFPLIDSVIALGEFERGKTLQYALNSLVNLYLDGVKYSIFPPLHINPFGSDVQLSTVKWGPGAKWLMRRPNVDVQSMQNLNPRGLDTFQSTYSFLLSALMSQAGTTEVSAPAMTEPTVGRTPAAVNFIRARETARDNWETFMLDKTIEQVMDRWVALISQKLPGKVVVRLFDDEIAAITKKYPDVKKLIKEGRTVPIEASKIRANEGYDYRHEQNSTVQPATDLQARELTSVLELLTAKPDIMAKMQSEGKNILVSELMERLLRLTSIKDPERIIVDTKSVEEAGTTEPPDTMGAPPPMALGPGGVPPGVPTGGQPEVPQFTDPEIAAMAAQAASADEIRGIPEEGGLP